MTKLNPLFVTTGDTIMEYGTDADEMYILNTLVVFYIFDIGFF